MRPLVLKGHTKPIKDLQFNRENDLLFSASTDRLVTLWSSEYGERIGTYLHQAAIYTMAITQDSKYMVSGDSTGCLYLWEVCNGKLLKTIATESTKNPSIKSAYFSEGEQKVLVSDSERGVGAQSKIYVYNFKDILSTSGTGINNVIKIKPELTIAAPGKEKISKARWLNNNKNIISTSESGVIYNYDASTGKEILSKKIHEAEIMDFDISKYEEVLLTASKDGKSLVLDPDNFNVVQTFFPQSPTRNINSCKISPLLSVDNDDEKRFHAFIAGGQESRDVTTTHSNKGGFELLIYDMLFGKELGAIQGHFGPINTLTISSDGVLLATGSEESSVRVNKLNTDEYRNLN